MPVQFHDPLPLKDPLSTFAGPVRSRTLPVSSCSPFAADSGRENHNVIERLFPTPPGSEEATFSTLQTLASSATTLSSSASSPSLSVHECTHSGGPNYGNSFDDADLSRPPFRHWRPQPTSFPLEAKFTFSEAVRLNTSAHPSHTNGYAQSYNCGQHDLPVTLPPYISPADSPADRPSTPLSESPFSGFTAGGAAVLDSPMDMDQRPGPEDIQWSAGTGPAVGGAGYPAEIGGGRERREGDVERSISAVMASESNSRSRKATQRLGLFRENDQAIEERGREKQRREEKEREREKDRQEKQRAKEKEKEKEDGSRGGPAKGKGQAASISLTIQDEENEKSSGGSPSNFVSVKRTKDVCSRPPCDEPSSKVLDKTSTPASTFNPFHATVDGNESSGIQSKIGSISGSTKMTSEIRADTSIAPLAPKSSSPASITTAALGGRSDISFQDHQDLSRGVPCRDFESVGGLGHPEDDEDEDEESDKDEIQSALYIPHPTPSILPEPSISHKVGPAANQYNIPSVQELRVESDNAQADGIRRKVREESPEFDLSIQSGDEEFRYQGRRQSIIIGDDYKSYHSNTEGYSSATSRFSDISDSYDDFSNDENDRTSSGYQTSSSSETEDTTPTATPILRDSRTKHDVAHNKKPARKAHPSNASLGVAPQVPLGAVELKPYNHQVGGHTALFRFSRRAVCKSLSNRENEFYEAVEKRHPQLLGFLPK